MTTIDLGKITFAFKGTYNPKTAYEPLDLVGFKKSTYICKKDSQGIAPDNADYWGLFIAGVPDLTAKGQILGSPILIHGQEQDFLKIQANSPIWNKYSVRKGQRVASLPIMQNSNGYMMAYLMADNTLRACGYANGFCANGSATSHTLYLPQTVAIDPDNPTKTPFVALYGGNSCFFTLTADGEVYGWGYNTQGQLGLGDTLNRPIASRINWFVENNIQIKDIILPSCGRWGEGTTYFLTTKGLLYACGFNGYSQLGNNTAINSNIPVRCGELTDIVYVAVSVGHFNAVYAVDSNGDVYSWGYNGYGQLGSGNTTTLKVPTKIAGLSNVKKIVATGDDSQAAGNQPASFALALTHDGNVLACGFNGYGQLGLGDLTQQAVFTPLSGGFSHIKDIFACSGYYGFSALIDSNHELWLWGFNSYGVQGMGDVLNKSVPNKPTAAFQGNIAKVFLGGDYSYNFAYVLSKDGQVWCAGYGDYGQLGFFNHDAVNSTFKKPPLPTDVKVVDVCISGYEYNASVFLLLEDGRVLATGVNNHGQLGIHPSNPTNCTVFEQVIF